MSQAHTPYPNNYQQTYQSHQQQQIPQYQQHATGYQRPGSSSFYNAQQQVMSPSQDAYQTPVQHPYSNQAQQRWSPQPPLQQNVAVNASPMAPSPHFMPVVAAHQSPGSTTPSFHSPQSSTYQVGIYTNPAVGAASPSQQNPVFSQGSYQNPITPAPARRPLPTPNTVPRPVTQPPPNRRPLPEPQPSSAPSSPFRHRPSQSVSSTSNVTTSAFSVPHTHAQTRQATDHTESRFPRPLPQPMPRSTKSLDLTQSTSPVSVFSHSGPLPPPGQRFVPHWKRTLPNAPEQQNGSPPTLSRTATALRPLPFPIQKQGTTPPSAAVSLAARPPMTERTMSAGDSGITKVPSSFPLRDRSRTLPEALPAPTAALPHRPDSVVVQNSQSSVVSNINGFPESPISSESEDLYENALLRRPLPRSSIIVPPRVPSPPPATQSRFIERSPERGRGPGRDVKAPRRLSLVSRMAEMSMNEAALGKAPAPVATSNSHPMPALGRALTQPSAPRWPAELPPLPRAPLSHSEAGEQRTGSREPSPGRSQSSSFSHQQMTPTRSAFSQVEGGSENSSRFPPPPQHPNSPTRSHFSSQNRSRESSPGRTQTQSQRPPPLPPRNNPASPTRARFPRQAPEREPALPAPRAQRMFPNLDDAPPPSLRRTPSPSPTRTSGFANDLTHRNGVSGLPQIRTQDVPKMVPSSSAATPNSASSAFSLSAFPTPPQQRSTNFSSGFGTRSATGMSPSTRSDRRISFPASVDDDFEYDEAIGSAPSINISGPNTPAINFNGMPDITINGSDDHDDSGQIPIISVGGPGDNSGFAMQRKIRQRDLGPLPSERSKNGLFCGGCSGTIIGRAVYTTDASWHPGCLKCTTCGAYLENLAVCEYEGRPYCSLDYYENFAPRCHHCQTAIADPNYITLKDEQLGERTYHEQHFFCAECGDPFLPPSTQPRSFSGEGKFDAAEGFQFIVHCGHPYCEDCHVRLRMPKCKKCSKSLRLDDDQLEFLGAKYCPECFVCKGCDGSFVNGQLFVRDKKPFCRRCYDIIVKSEL